MSASSDPRFPSEDDHVQQTDDILRQHAANPETEVEAGDTAPLADRDPANPVRSPGEPTPKQLPPDEQAAPAAEYEAGIDAAEDEAQENGNDVPGELRD